MPIDERWDKLSEADWDEFARAWIEALRNPADDSDVGESVIMMNFMARPEHQWRFIMTAVEHASDEELGHIAAGPVEQLLSKYGDAYIAEVERRAGSDPNFARMLTNVWKHMMSDEVWGRVEKLKERYTGQ